MFQPIRGPVARAALPQPQPSEEFKQSCADAAMMALIYGKGKPVDEPALVAQLRRLPRLSTIDDRDYGGDVRTCRCARPDLGLGQPGNGRTGLNPGSEFLSLTDSLAGEKQARNHRSEL